MIDVEQIKKLHEETGAGVIEAKKALEDSGGDFKIAKTVLEKLGLEKAAEKNDREVSKGFIGTYVHHHGALASLASVACETDFVARTSELQTLAKEIAMQVAAMKPQSVSELLEQEYVRDPSKKIKDLVVELSAKVGENIVIKDFKVLEV